MTRSTGWRSDALSWLVRALRIALGLVVLGLVWEGAVVFLRISPSTLPRLSTVFSAVAATPGAYLDSVLRTGLETVLGYMAGTAFGVVIGALFFRLRVVRDMVLPLFIVSQTIPVIAFGAVVVLWFGNTLLAKAVMAFYLTFFPVTVNTLLGLQSADPKQEALIRGFGASPGQVFWKLQFPGALPQIFVALRLAASLSLIGAIVGEWFGDTVGLGVLLLQATYNENVVGIWAAVLASACLGITFYATVAAVERRLVFWSAEQ